MRHMTRAEARMQRDTIAAQRVSYIAFNTNPIPDFPEADNRFPVRRIRYSDTLTGRNTFGL